jgi:type VII secretion integral membrane protein EccD
MRVPSAGPAPPYCRVTVLAPRCRVDVVLPVDVPVAELLPMVLELLCEPGPGLLAPWQFSWATGMPLPASATLRDLGVLDGELLRVGPAAPTPPAPVFDDPVDALAATVPGHGPDPRVRAVVVVALALAAAVLIARSPSPVAVALGVVGAAGFLARAASLARRVPAEGGAAGAHGAAAAGVLLAAGAAAAALPAASGAAQVLLVAAAAGTTATVGHAVVRVVSPVLVAVVVAGAVVAGAALLRLRFEVPPGALAAGAGALALAVGPLLPSAALRLAGLPRPVVPADAQELVAADAAADLLPPDELAARSELARRYLAGLVGSTAVLAAGAVVPAAAAGGWSGPALAAVVLATLGLRSRGFADPAVARTLLGAAVAGGLGLAAVVALHSPTVIRLAAAAALALAAVAASAVRREPIGSPVARRAVDVLEGLLVAGAIPLALGVMDAYALVRGL